MAIIIKKAWKIIKSAFKYIVKGSVKPPPQEKSKNPYQLIWYRQGWSDNRIRKNNTKYWEWENKNNKKI